MRITGSTIIKVAVTSLAALFVYDVYAEYQKIREEERAEARKSYNEQVNDDVPEEYIVTPDPKETSEVIKEAAKNVVSDFIVWTQENPAEAIVAFGIGCLGGVCYIAGANDGIDKMRDAAEEAIDNAEEQGMLLGFAGGRYWTREHVKKANPEYSGQIINNLDIYERLHKDSREMAFTKEELTSNPTIMNDFNHMRVKEAE